MVSRRGITHVKPNEAQGVAGTGMKPQHAVGDAFATQVHIDSRRVMHDIRPGVWQPGAQKP